MNLYYRHWQSKKQVGNMPTDAEGTFMTCNVIDGAVNLEFEGAYFLHTGHGESVLEEGDVDDHPALSLHHMVPAVPHMRIHSLS